MAKYRIEWTEKVIQNWHLDVEADSAEEAEDIYHVGNHITGDEVLGDSDFIDSDFIKVEEIK